MTGSRSAAAGAVLEPLSPTPGSTPDVSSRFVVVSWGGEMVEAEVLDVRGVPPHVQLHLALPSDPAVPDDAHRLEIDVHVSELPADVAAYWLGSANP
ncbi:MAG: hypothetical protein ACLGIA_10785 [Actinomycetes bacterium]